MKNIKLSALFLAAVLFLTLGSTNATAQEMRCATGKCASTMTAPNVCNSQTDCKCQACDCAKDNKACTCQACECANNSKKAPNTAMKCDNKKCGSSMRAQAKEYERGEIKTH